MKSAAVQKVVLSVSSPYPPSFAGNPWLYGSSLAALLAIGTFGLIISRWMMRDLWRDRFVDHPTTLLFCFRIMVFLASSAAFLRSLPEVVYMTCYGEKGITPSTLATILLVKRGADTLSLPVVVAWMAMLTFIYPFVVIVFRAQEARGVKVDPLSFWPRLVRPFIILSLVVALAVLMAFAKGAGLKP